uniref:Uncharacterized protein n=1 Tax=Anguilla anguilla TaxID=7936 RepID=A0A0E9XQ12_ANGAN
MAVKYCMLTFVLFGSNSKTCCLYMAGNLHHFRNKCTGFNRLD